MESGNHFSLIDFYYLTLCMQVERQLSKMTMIEVMYTVTHFLYRLMCSFTGGPLKDTYLGVAVSLLRPSDLKGTDVCMLFL